MAKRKSGGANVEQTGSSRDGSSSSVAVIGSVVVLVLAAAYALKGSSGTVTSSLAKQASTEYPALSASERPHAVAEAFPDVPFSWRPRVNDYNVEHTTSEHASWVTSLAIEAPKVRLARFQNGFAELPDGSDLALRGIVAVDKVEKDDVIVKVPMSSLLTAQTSHCMSPEAVEIVNKALMKDFRLKHNIGAQADADREITAETLEIVNTSPSRLHFSIMCEMGDPSSRWRGYFDEVGAPSGQVADIPIPALKELIPAARRPSGENREQVLEAIGTVGFTPDQHSSSTLKRSEWTSLWAATVEQHPEQLPSSVYNVEASVKAWDIISSRSFGVELADSEDSMIMAIVPFGDFLNHKQAQWSPSRQTARWRVVEGHLHIVALEEYTPGMQVYSHYGGHTDVEFLSRYGFAVTPYPGMRSVFRPPSPPALMKLATTILAEEASFNLNDWAEAYEAVGGFHLPSMVDYFTIGVQHTSVERTILPILYVARVLTQSASEVVRPECAKVLAQNSTLGMAAEGRAWRLVNRILEAELEAYQGDPGERLKEGGMAAWLRLSTVFSATRYTTIAQAAEAADQVASCFQRGPSLGSQVVDPKCGAVLIQLHEVDDWCTASPEHIAAYQEASLAHSDIAFRVYELSEENARQADLADAVKGHCKGSVRGECGYWRAVVDKLQAMVSHLQD